MTIKKHPREVIKRLIILTTVVAFGVTLLAPIVSASEHPWGSGGPGLNEPVYDTPWGEVTSKSAGASPGRIVIEFVKSVRFFPHLHLYISKTVNRDQPRVYNGQPNPTGTGAGTGSPAQ